MTLLGAVLAAAPPSRDGARDAARRELSKQIYRRRQAGLLPRILEWLFTRLGRLFEKATSVVPGGLPGLLLLVAIVVAIVVVLRLRLGPLRRTDLLTDERAAAAKSADDYRAEAAGFAADGNWREALRARFRAVIRELEQRGILDQRAGRTAGEIAFEAGAAVPAIAAAMQRAADVFNQTWYGDRAASPSAYDSIAQVDDSVRGGKNTTVLAAR